MVAFTLDRLRISLVGSNVHRMFQRGHENLAVPDLPGADRRLDCSHSPFDLVARDCDLQADSWQEIQDRFVSREELSTPGATEALDFRDGYSGDVKLRQSQADLVNPEVLDKRRDNFHCWHPLGHTGHKLAGFSQPRCLCLARRAWHLATVLVVAVGLLRLGATAGGVVDRLAIGVADHGAVGKRNLHELPAMRSVFERMDHELDRHARRQRLRLPTLPY